MFTIRFQKINENKSNVETGVQTIRTANESFEQITQIIGEVSKEIERSANMVNQLDEGTNEVSDSIKKSGRFKSKGSKGNGEHLCSYRAAVGIYGSNQFI